MSIDISSIMISVIIPVYNAQHYILDCVSSVINQSSPVYEILLVDDGSTDNSLEICRDIESRYPTVKVFHKANQGQLSAREFGVSRATGNWFVFVDADDTLKNTAIETIEIAIHQFNPDCVFYGWDRVKNDQIVEGYVPEFDGTRVISDKSVLFELVFTNSSFNSLCRKAIRADYFSRDMSNYYNIKLAEDLLHSLEVYERGSCFVFLNRSLYNYTINESSKTNTIVLSDINNECTARNMVYQLLKDENVFSNQQWKNYNAFALSLFVEQIKRLLTINTGYAVFKKCCKELAQTDYYKKYIWKIREVRLQWTDRVIWLLFKSKCYLLLRTINYLYRKRHASDF